MTLYPLRPLADLCERVTDGTHQPPKFTSSGIPFLFVSNIVNGQISFATTKFIAPDTHCELNRRCPVEVGDVIVSTVGSYGNAAVVHDDRPFSFQRHIAHIKLKTNLLDAVYLVHALHSAFVRAQIDKSVRGVAQKTLNLSELKKLQIPAPAINEQRRIADVLDRAEALRAKRRAALAELDGLDVSIFRNMFTNPGSETLSVAPISALAADSPNSIRTGPFGSQLLHSEFQNEGIAVLGIDNIVHNYFEQGKIRRISQRKYQELKRYTVHSGDVLISIMGTCGRCAIAPRHIELSINTKHLCCITLDRGKCIPEYLRACFLWHPQVQYLLGVRERGAVMPGLNMQLIKELQIPVPPLALQQEFARRVAAVERLKAVQRASLAELDALFASLQDRAFRGAL